MDMHAASADLAAQSAKELLESLRAFLPEVQVELLASFEPEPHFSLFFDGREVARVGGDCPVDAIDILAGMCTRVVVGRGAARA